MPNHRIPRQQDNAPSAEQSTTAREAVQLTVNAIRTKTTIDPWPRRASALRDLSHAIYQTDGIISPLPSAEFHKAPGTTLFRGISHYKYVRENLNGDWHGTGFYTDGNYYAGWSDRDEAISYYGLDLQGWGWAIAYKLNPLASLIDIEQLLNIPLESFISQVRARFDISESGLTTIHGSINDAAMRAVLLGHDAAFIPQEDHYVVYNNNSLVCLGETTPWHQGLEETPIEFTTNSVASRACQHAKRPSPDAIQHQISALQANQMDEYGVYHLQYTPAAKRVRQHLTEVKP